MPKFYLTTAIDYSNGDPHLGHALEKVGADCIARYRRLRGDDVHFLMGMDEHSQAVLQAAEQNGVLAAGVGGPDGDDVRDVSGGGSNAATTTGSAPPSRGTTGRVAAAARQIARKNPDDLFVGEYEGLYCFGCEEFKQPSQIVNGHCIEHPTLELVPTKERNHFFRLSRYRDPLLSLHPVGRVPGRARHPAQRDRPAARGRAAGHLGLAGTASRGASRFPAIRSRRSTSGSTRSSTTCRPPAIPDAGYERLWPADLHVVGKGITRFHCVIWPAMLLTRGLALAARGVGPRLRAVGRRQDVEVGRDGGEPGRGDRPPRRRRAALLPAAGGRLRGRRQFHLGALRRALHGGPGRWAGEPRLARRWPCWPSTGRASCRTRRRKPRWTLARPAGGRAPTPGAWTPWTSAAGRRRPGSSSGPPTCTSSRWRPGRWPRPASEAELDAVAGRARAGAVPAGGPGGPVRPGQSPSPVAVAGAAREMHCAAPGWHLAAAPGGGPGYQQTRGPVPQARTV